MSKCTLPTCNKEAEGKFCCKEHRWEHVTQMDKLIPPIVNRDFLSDKENGMIAAFLKKKNYATV